MHCPNQKQKENINSNIKYTRRSATHLGVGTQLLQSFSNQRNVEHILKRMQLIRIYLFSAPLFSDNKPNIEVLASQTDLYNLLIHEVSKSFPLQKVPFGTIFCHQDRALPSLFAGLTGEFLEHYAITTQCSHSIGVSSSTVIS